MSELVLHPATAQQLRQHIAHPPHALLLQGAEGIGKDTVAVWLAWQTLNLDNTTKLAAYPYFHVISTEGQSISIDAVRELQKLTRLKTVGKSNGIQRLIIIKQADLLTIEAQNALLKLLEEPPADTMIILTASNEQSLLPTIRSRTQILTIKQPSHAQLSEHFAAQQLEPAQVQQAYLMSGGLPGLMYALLHDASTHPLSKAVAQARDILRSNTFERLSMVDTLAKQRTDALRVLFVLQQMATAALEQAAKVNSQTTNHKLTQWQHILTAAYEAEDALLANAQAKLVLTNLFLRI